MRKIVTASRAKAVLKWIFSVSFVIGVSIFVNDAFIRDVTAPDAGIDVVIMSVILMMSVTQSAGDAVDRLATVSLAGALITMGGLEGSCFPTIWDNRPASRSPQGFLWWSSLLCLS